MLERSISLWISNVELVRFYKPIQRQWYWADQALRNFMRRKRQRLVSPTNN
jgi:hypothetical protein